MLFLNTIVRFLYFDFCLVVERISPKTKWSSNGQTMAGGHERGDALNQLHCPYSVEVDDDGIMFIVGTDNHRILRWWKRKRKSTRDAMASRQPHTE